MCGTTHRRNIFYFDTNDDAFFGDGHDFFIFFYHQCAYNFTIAFAWTYGKYPFTASCLLTIFIHIGAFAIAVFCYYQKLCIFAGYFHAYYMVIFQQFDTAYPFGSSGHRACFFFIKSNSLSISSYQNDILFAVSELYANEFIAFFQIDSNDAITARGIVFSQRCFLHHTISGSSHQEQFFAIFGFEGFQRNHGSDFFAACNIQQIYNSSTFCSAPCFRNIVYLQAIAFSFVGKENHIIMGRSGEDMFYKVFFFGGHSCNAATAPSLTLIGITRHTFDIAGMADGDYHIFFFD